MGFTTPIGTFVNDSSDRIREQITASRFKDLYNVRGLNVRAENKFSREVFGLLMLDLWLNRYATVPTHKVVEDPLTVAGVPDAVVRGPAHVGESPRFIVNASRYFWPAGAPKVRPSATQEWRLDPAPHQTKGETFVLELPN